MCFRVLWLTNVHRERRLNHGEVMLKKMREISPRRTDSVAGTCWNLVYLLCALLVVGNGGSEVFVLFNCA